MTCLAQAMRLVAVVGMVWCGAVWTAPAHAQFGEAAGIADAMQPEYYRRDIDIISSTLKLDETQRVIVRTFFEDYEAAFEAGVERMKQRFDTMRDDLSQTTNQKEILRKVLAPFRDWGKEKSQLGLDFLNNVEVILTPDQHNHWPSLLRRLYRERFLPRGRLAGESVNLLNSVRDLHLDARMSVQIQPLLEAYEIALDQALRAREEVVGSQDNLMLQSLEEQDAEKSLIALRRYIERQIAVRNVNDLHLEQIATALPGDLSSEFRANALDRAYPRIYRETPVQRIFKVAREMDGLDPGIRQSIFNLEFEFLAELATLNQELLRALREHEPKEALDRAADFSRRMAGQSVEARVDPTRDLFTKREETSRGYMRRLRTLLTEDQFALLPGAYRWIEQPVVSSSSLPESKAEMGGPMNPQPAKEGGTGKEGTGTPQRRAPK